MSEWWAHASTGRPVRVLFAAMLMQRLIADYIRRLVVELGDDRDLLDLMLTSHRFGAHRRPQCCVSTRRTHLDLFAWTTADHNRYKDDP